MIQVKEVTAHNSSDYEYHINETVHSQATRGWKFIDIKHSVAADRGYGIIFSAVLIFDDSPTADIPTSLNQ